MSENHFHRIWTLRAHRRLKNIAMVCRVQGSGFKVQGTGFRVQGGEFRVQGAGCRVQGGCGGWSFPSLSPTSPNREAWGTLAPGGRRSKGGMYLS